MSTEKTCYYRIQRDVNGNTCVCFGFSKRREAQIVLTNGSWATLREILENAGVRLIELNGKRLAG